MAGVSALTGITSRFFLVPKPLLGNASAPEAPASGVSRHGKPGNLPGKCVPKLGLGNEKAWERETRRLGNEKRFSEPAELPG